MIFENFRQFVTLAATSTRDNVKLYGFTTAQQTTPQPESPLPIQPTQTTQLTQPTQTQTQQLEQQITTTIDPHSQTTNSSDPPSTQDPQNSPLDSQPPADSTLPTELTTNHDSPPNVQHKQQFIEIEWSNIQQFLDGRVHGIEFSLSPSLRFLYLILGNSLFWHTYQQLGLPLLPFPPSPPSSPTSEIFQGPITTSSYRNSKEKIERMWMDENCEKVLGHVVNREDKRGEEKKEVDISVLFDPRAFDAGDLEDVLQGMAIE